MTYTFRFIDLYANKEPLFKEEVGNDTYWMFESISPNYKYVTFATTKIGNKKGDYYGWNDIDRAIANIKSRVETAKNIIKRKEEQRQRAKEIAVGKFDEIKIGDIYMTSWGYEAQWYDFYKVIDKKNGYVKIQKLMKKNVEGDLKYGWDSRGYVVPTDEPDGEPMRRMVKSYGFGGENDYESSCYLWDGKPHEEANWH